MTEPSSGLAARLALEERRLAEDGRFSYEEVQLALRNRGMPLEALRYEVTPTGLHYVLTHFDIPALDESAWRLEVGGLVERPLRLSLAELKAMGETAETVTLECAGNGRALTRPRPVGQPWTHDAVSTARWSGVRLREVLDAARPRAGATEAVFWGADHGIERGVEHTYARSLPLATAASAQVLLAYAMNGEPLPPQHGAPLRLVAPGWYGMASVKWLVRIELLDRPFDGYQQFPNYHYRRRADEPGEPVRAMRVRALMIPPGFPDYFSRVRVVEAGRVVLAGRAWSGFGARVARVEVAVNGVWREARLGAQAGPYAWRAWSFEWEATPGEYELACRATDEHGAVQPLEQNWNLAGMGNNVVQRVPVLVRARAAPGRAVT